MIAGKDCSIARPDPVHFRTGNRGELPAQRQYHIDQTDPFGTCGLAGRAQRAGMNRRLDVGRIGAMLQRLRPSPWSQFLIARAAPDWTNEQAQAASAARGIVRSRRGPRLPQSQGARQAEHVRRSRDDSGSLPGRPRASSPNACPRGHLRTRAEYTPSSFRRIDNSSPRFRRQYRRLRS